MDVCLLCLESNKGNDECITINSDKWNQQNLHELIEKHLWPMEAINSFSWMCIRCDEELYDFHKFFKRIEEAHKNLDTFFKHEDEMLIPDNNGLHHTDSIKSKDYLKDNIFDENELEDNISVEPPVINEFVLDDPFVKIEEREELNTENGNFSKYRKRARPKEISLNKDEENDLYDTDSTESRHDFKDNIFDENNSEDNISVEPPVINDFVLDEPSVKIEKTEEVITVNGNFSKNRKRGRPKKISLTKEEENELYNTDSIKNKHDFKDNIFVGNALEAIISCEQPVINELVSDDPFGKIEKGLDLNTNNGYFSKNRKRNSQKKISLNREEDELLTKKIRHNRRANQKSKREDLMSENISNDYETDSETVSESIDLKVKKRNHRNLDKETIKEYDRIIAENFKFFCNICQMPLDNFVSLRKHCKVEHKKRGYARCCKRNFYTRSLLVDHINVHLNREYFKCQHCGKVFSDRSRLQCHKKFHDDASNLDKCKECGKLFADKCAFKKHKLTHSSEKSYPCNICGRCFSTNFILNHHIESIHENKYVQICEICGKSIRRPTAFASHMETHDTNAAPISCDVCGLILSNKEGLKSHKKSQHPEGGKKEHACRICLKISPTERALKAHIRSVHEQGLDLKCNLCEKSFKRPGALKEHVATHTGRPLYTCLWCPRTFISNSNMYNHRKSAHLKEWEEHKRKKYIGNKL